MQKLNIVRRRDMYRDLLRPPHLRHDRVNLANALALQPAVFQHIQKVHIPSEIELICVIYCSASCLEDAHQDTVYNRGSYLRLNIISNARHARTGEPTAPLRVRNEEG